jgi:hypothetical protein
LWALANLPCPVSFDLHHRTLSSTVPVQATPTISGDGHGAAHRADPNAAGPNPFWI